ncbi:MAG: cytochrome c oxidase subunit [Thermoanaerobaculia bacterium]|jgi:cytochrome c oxidase subunit 2|nr:cytochrome c oxidase subunit [Thermoanaerobaculia bacterium]
MNRFNKFLIALLLTLSLAAATALVAQPGTTPRVVEINAKKFEFTPNVVTLKKDEPVTIHFTSTDRAHGLFIKALKIDLDADAGKPAEVTITPHEAGSFGAICDHYCGAGHGNMKMMFVVE